MPLSSPLPSVRVYQLLPEGALTANADVIAKQVFRVSSENDGARLLQISPSGSTIRYFDLSKFGEGAQGGNVPRAAGDAEVAARGFFETANRSLNSAGVLRSLKISELFPTSADIVSAEAHTSILSGVSDYWVCRFGMSLPTGTNQGDATVVGAFIDAYIGLDAALIGLQMRWRPSTGDLIAPAMPPPPTPITSAGIVLPQVSSAVGASGIGEPDLPPMIYLLCEDDVAQSYLAPYYKADDGSVSSLGPASNYSVTAAIETSGNGGGTTLKAKIEGGSGRFDLAWKRISLASSSDSYDESLGSSLVVSVPDEPAFVRLEIIDQITGQGARGEAGIRSSSTPAVLG